MSATGAQLLIQGLLEQGVDTLFGYPGGAIMPVYDALYDQRGRLRHVLVRHEQGAVHAAQGYARAGGGVGVCLATSGPGASNLITGLFDALADSTPLVCIVGQVRRESLGSDAFQEADILGMSLAASKWAYQIVDPAEVPAALAAAFRIATGGRPGPVMLEITRDAQQATAEEIAPELSSALFDREDRLAPTRGALDPAAVARAAGLINQARRPLLMLGQGVLIAGAESEARELAERAGLPTASTLLGLSAFPADHRLNVGMLGMHGSYGANLMTNEADVIVGVGLRFDDRVTGRVADYARQAKIVHIDIDPAEIGRHVPAEVALVADAKTALRALLDRVQPRRHLKWLARFRACDREEHAAVAAAELRPNAGPLRMAEVVRRIAERCEGQALIVSDVGQHQMIAARYSVFCRPRSHITSGGAGTMGFALPAAAGAKLAVPEREVVAVIGDGGFQMTLQELGTIAQERLAVKIVVLNNRRLGMVRQWQELFFERRYSFVHMETPDFVTLCRAYGIDARRVDERAELDEALAELLGADGPRFLEVRVASEENVFPMIPAGAAVDEIRLR